MERESIGESAGGRSISESVGGKVSQLEGESTVGGRKYR